MKYNKLIKIKRVAPTATKGSRWIYTLEDGLGVLFKKIIDRDHSLSSGEQFQRDIKSFGYNAICCSEDQKYYYVMVERIEKQL